MISLDTSILLRYVTKDHARLSPVALAIISDNACFVSEAALMEMVFTLESVYPTSRDEIVTALRTFRRDFQRLAARIGATPRVEHFKA